MIMIEQASNKRPNIRIIEEWNELDQVMKDSLDILEWAIDIGQNDKIINKCSDVAFFIDNIKEVI